MTTFDADVSTVSFSTKPDRAELAHFLSMIEEQSASLDPSTRSTAARWVGRGSFSQAVDLVEQVLARTPGNHGVQELKRLLRSSALRLLRGRLGSRQRRVCPSSNADPASLPPLFARFVVFAETRPNLGELLCEFGRDDLRAHEQVAALVRTGFLTLGAPPRRVGDTDHGAPDTEPPETGS